MRRDPTGLHGISAFTPLFLERFSAVKNFVGADFVIFDIFSVPGCSDLEIDDN